MRKIKQNCVLQNHLRVWLRPDPAGEAHDAPKTLNLPYITSVLHVELEVHGRARREAARRRNTEWTVNLAIRNCSLNNATCQMTPKTVL